MANGDNKFTIEEMKERLALLDTEVSLSKELLTSTERSAELKKNAIAQAQASIQAENSRIAAMEKQGELTEAQVKTHQRALGDLQKELNLQEKNLKNIKESVKAGDALASSMGNYLTILTGVDDTYKSTLLGSMFDAAASTEGMQHAMEKTAKAAKAFPKMALGTLFAQIEQSTIGVLTATIGLNAELAKATGIAGKNFTDAIQSNQRALSDWGVSITDSGEALKSVYTQFSGFRQLTEESQQSLQRSVSQFAAIGVNADTATNFMDGLTKAFGMTIPQAADLTNQFIGLSGEVKFTAEELMTSFASLNKDLAAFGKRAPEIFKNLTKQSDALGVSLENLVSVAKQFDTFEGAADAVGKLNTIMGGNFIDMQRIMSMGYDERIQYIKDEVTARMGSFESMNQFQRRYVALAAGFSSVEDAMKVLGDQQVENDKTLEKYGLTQEKMKQLAKDSAGPMKLLRASMQQLAIDVAPLVVAITDAASWLSTFIKENEVAIKTFAIFAGSLFFVWKILQGFAALKNVMATIRGAGAAAGIMAESKALLIKGKVLAALTPIATKASVALAGVGASMWPVVAAAAILTAGIVAVVYILTEFFKVLVESNAPILEMGASMGIMAASLALVGLMGKAAFVGLAALGGGLIIAAVGWMMMAPALASVAQIAKSMEAMGGGDPFAKWTTGLKAFANAADDSESKLAKVHSVLGSMSLAAFAFNAPTPAVEFVKSVASIDDNSVAGINATKELVLQLNQATKNENVAALQKLIAEIKGLTKTTGKAAAAKQDINLILKDEVFGRAVRRHTSNAIG